MPIDIFEEIKKIAAEADAKIQATIKPLVESGNEKVVNAATTLLRTINEPVKTFFKSLDHDWTDEEREERVKSYAEKGGPPMSEKGE